MTPQHSGLSDAHWLQFFREQGGNPKAAADVLVAARKWYWGEISAHQLMVVVARWERER